MFPYINSSVVFQWVQVLQAYSIKVRFFPNNWTSSFSKEGMLKILHGDLMKVLWYYKY
jgi:hypothetical protein